MIIQHYPACDSLVWAAQESVVGKNNQTNQQLHDHRARIAV